MPVRLKNNNIDLPIIFTKLNEAYYSLNQINKLYVKSYYCYKLCRKYITIKLYKILLN